MGKYSFLLGKLSKSSKGVGKEAEKTIKKAKKVDPNSEEGQILRNKIEDMGTRNSGGMKAIKKDVTSSDWKKGLSKDELADILGSPKPDAEGVLMHRKKGGSIGVGAAKRGFGAVRKK